MSNIIVTGSSAGLGLSVARILLADPRQHKLLLCAGSNDASLKELQSSAENKGRVSVFKGDMGNLETPRKVAEQFKAAFGDKLDALILNHGTLGNSSRISEMESREWEHVFRINVTSYVELARLVLPQLRNSNGRIIMTSSGAAEAAYTSWGAYGASKAAINHFTKTLAKEEKAITTVAVRPGMVDTKMQQDIRDKYLVNMDEDDRGKFTGAFEKGQLLPPDAPGHVIAKLAIDAPKDLSGLFLK